MGHSTQVVHITESFSPSGDTGADFVGEPRLPQDDDGMIDAKISAYDQAIAYMLEQVGLLQKVKAMVRRLREAVDKVDQEREALEAAEAAVWPEA